MVGHRVLILIDGGNIAKSCWAMEDEDTMVDYETLINDVLRGREICQVRFYQEGGRISKSFQKRIRNGFYGVCIPTGKTTDIQLVIDAMMHLYHTQFDTMILMSGDGDFAPLLDIYKKMGKRVEVCSIKHSTSKELRYTADSWYEIQPNYFFKLNQNNHDEERQGKPEKED